MSSVDDITTRNLVPSVDGSLSTKLPSFVLSAVVGTHRCVLGLDGLFTGNLVILAAHIVTVLSP